MPVMTDSTKSQTNGHDCPPAPEHPAPLPTPPGDTCTPVTWPDPPPYEYPEKCEVDCDCPKKPGSDSPKCLDDLIQAQAEEIAKADKAKAFKTDLEALLANAKKANQEYTPEKYKKLLKQWQEQDAAIAELVRKLACAVPCWKCVIECYICPLFNDLHYWEEAVYGDGTHCTDVHDLQDLLYWHTRDKEAKERAFTRIKNVLTAWGTPGTTIEKALADNQALIDSSSKVIGTEPGKAIVDVFLTLIPRSLAIAPPKGTIDPATNTEIKSKIDEKYTKFCECALEPPEPDDCCGPNVGQLTLLQRLVGPLPYLINPSDYYRVICCLVTQRYSKAKEVLAAAEAAVLKYDAEVKKFKAQLDAGLKSFDKDAKARVPGVIDCCDYKSTEPTGQTGQTSR
jgi:hypothetical protein